MLSELMASLADNTLENKLNKQNNLSINNSRSTMAGPPDIPGTSQKSLPAITNIAIDPT
jgi:hypothetical protein